jgi:arylsulfatase A-like enzyme
VYGYARPTTIQLDATARAGVSFDNVIASGSWTYPNHASLFTGEYPWVHGAHLAEKAANEASISSESSVTALHRNIPTLAEKFSAAGYRTAAFSANTWLARDLGLMRGFDEVKVARELETIDNAVEEIRERRASGSPLFLFVNLIMAHSPYYDGPGEFSIGDASFFDPETAPEWVRPYTIQGSIPAVNLDTAGRDKDGLPGQVRFLRGDLKIDAEGMRKLHALYDAGVRGADFGYGRILSAWIEAGQDTVIAVTSDHGEALGERGHLGHQGVVDPAVLRVPMIVSAPGRLPADVRIKEFVQLRELHPMLLDLAGIDGRGSSSLTRLVQRKPRSESAVLSKAWKNHGWASEVGGRYSHDWHLYQRGRFALFWNGSESSPLVELYDTVRDPGMQDDVSAHQRDRVQELLQRAKEAFREEVLTGTQSIPPELQSQLEQLGYLAN